MNLEKLLEFRFPQLEFTATPRDAMLYALGIGVGDRPEHPSDLQYIYEKGLKLVPSYVNVICHPGGWVLDPVLEINWVKLLHGGQSFQLHQALEAGKTYTGNFRITGVVDKGEAKGALLMMRKELHDKADGSLVSTVDATYFLRGDGGCGSTLSETPAPHAIPERAPDCSISLTTLPRAALIYRLSGDYNPIHADPELARKAGFERPILHGLCSVGVVTRAIIQTCCDDKPEALRSLELRFTSPVYPGETLETAIWRDGNVVSFRTRVVERDLIVLNNGRAVVSVG